MAEPTPFVKTQTELRTAEVAANRNVEANLRSNGTVVQWGDGKEVVTAQQFTSAIKMAQLQYMAENGGKKPNAKELNKAVMKIWNDAYKAAGDDGDVGQEFNAIVSKMDDTLKKTIEEKTEDKTLDGKAKKTIEQEVERMNKLLPEDLQQKISMNLDNLPGVKEAIASSMQWQGQGEGKQLDPNMKGGMAAPASGMTKA